MRPVAFYAIGGSVCWAGASLTDAQVERLCGLLWDEQIKARAGGHDELLAAISEALDELLGAFTQTRRWRAASGPAAFKSLEGIRP